MLSPGEKADLYRRVRAVLAEHYVDLGRMAIIISPSATRLTGELRRLPGMPQPLSGDLVREMMNRIRRIRGLPRLQPLFDDWQCDPSGRWAPTGARAAAARPKPRPRQGSSEAVDLEKDPPATPGRGGIVLARGRRSG